MEWLGPKGFGSDSKAHFELHSKIGLVHSYDRMVAASSRLLSLVLLTLLLASSRVLSLRTLLLVTSSALKRDLRCCPRSCRQKHYPLLFAVTFTSFSCTHVSGFLLWWHILCSAHAHYRDVRRYGSEQGFRKKLCWHVFNLLSGKCALVQLCLVLP